MVLAIDRFLFGLCFGMGFTIAVNVLNFIASMLGGHPVTMHN
jgi:hypothetical protein